MNEYKETNYYKNTFLKDMEKLGKELSANGFYNIKGTSGVIKFDVYRQFFEAVPETKIKELIEANTYQPKLIDGFYFSDGLNTLLDQLKPLANHEHYSKYKAIEKKVNPNFNHDKEMKTILQDIKNKQKQKKFNVCTETAEALPKIIGDHIVTDGSNLYKVENNKIRKIKQLNLDFFKKYSSDFIGLSEDIANIIENLPSVNPRVLKAMQYSEELKQYKKDYEKVKKTLLEDGLIPEEV